MQQELNICIHIDNTSLETQTKAKQKEKKLKKY